MKTIKHTLREALLCGGQIFKKAFGRPKSIRYKGPQSLVTETDKAVELAVTKIIRKKFPNHVILGEELGLQQRQASEDASRYKWIIDPVDGTSNFAHGLPLACVSIAFESD